MKIFGYDISFGKQVQETAIALRDDNIPEIEEIDAGTISPSEVKAVQSPVFIYTNNGGIVNKPTQRRNVFEPAEYDLYEIGRIQDVDGYVRQAYKKQVGLFLKEGFDYIGPNKKACKYIRTRFAQIAQATNIHHDELMRRLVREFISKSNAFLVKVRDEKASGGKVRTDINGKTLKPIAGYFLVAPEMMQVETDGNGRPRLWRQMMPNGIHLEFRPEDVVHFKFDCKEGFVFGTPIITPVIDDIRSLRKIEENVELLIYKHLFPMFQYIVGTESAPASIAEDGLREIDVVKQEVQFMPSEGSIVTPERHQIKAIGAEGKALKAEAYLEHFKQRVFAGLGMSAVDYGESDSSNRSTADNLSRALVDFVKDIQQSFEAQFNQYVVNELLQEANFDGEDMLTEENKVALLFRQIDIDKQIKVESHAADLFFKHGITWNEYRTMTGRDRILVPDDPEGGDPAKYPEWYNTYWKLFEEPQKIINAGDESFSVYTAAAAGNRSIGVKPGDVEGQHQRQLQGELAVAKAKAPVVSRVAKKDNFLAADYSSLKDIVSQDILQNKRMESIHSKVMLISEQMISKLRTAMNVAFINGFGADLASREIAKVNVTRQEIDTRAHLLIRRLSHDIETALIKRVDTDSNTKGSTVSAVFDAFRYRTDFITRTETTKAENLGKIYRATYGGATKGQYTVKEDTCETCKTHARQPIHMHNHSLDNAPPHHNACTCGLQIIEVNNG